MMDRQQAMTEAEGYIERMNLKALSEKDNDQLGTIVKEAYMSGMNTSQRAIFDHVDATLSMITKIARSLGVSTRKIFDLYLEVGKKGFLFQEGCKTVCKFRFSCFQRDLSEYGCFCRGSESSDHR